MKLNCIEGSVEIKDDKIIISQKSGIIGAAFGEGNQNIFIKDITSISVKKCSFINSGIIEISGPGVNKKLTFGGWVGRSKMNEAATYIENAVNDFISTQNRIKKANGYT